MDKSRYEPVYVSKAARKRRSRRTETVKAKRASTLNIVAAHANAAGGTLDEYRYRRYADSTGLWAGVDYTGSVARRMAASEHYGEDPWGALPVAAYSLEECGVTRELLEADLGDEVEDWEVQAPLRPSLSGTFRDPWDSGRPQVYPASEGGTE